RLMRLLELKAVIRRKRYTYKPHKPQHLAENILNRAFQEKYKKMEVLLTDITEFKYGVNSKAYFSAILDYGENKIIAYKLSKHNNNALVRDTMTQIENDLFQRRHYFIVIVDFNIHPIALNSSLKNIKLFKACPASVDVLTTVRWKTSGVSSKRKCIV